MRGEDQVEKREDLKIALLRVVTFELGIIIGLLFGLLLRPGWLGY